MLRLLLLALFAVSSPVPAQGLKLTPVDEAARDATWLRFKTSLFDALAKRDQKTVLGIVDSRIRNFSGKNGSAEFRSLWEPHTTDSPLWVELPKLLHLGGVYVKRENGSAEYCAPYVYYRWPDNASPSSNGAIIAKEVLLKAEPTADAGTLHVLSYEVVAVLDWEVADQVGGRRQIWVKIQTPTGIGYVPEEQIRSPLEYRACFVRSGAGWRMTGLEAGE